MAGKNVLNIQRVIGINIEKRIWKYSPNSVKRAIILRMASQYEQQLKREYLAFTHVQKYNKLIEKFAPSRHWQKPVTDYKRQYYRGTLVEGRDYYFPPHEAETCRLANVYEPYLLTEQVYLEGLEPSVFSVVFKKVILPRHTYKMQPILQTPYGIRVSSVKDVPAEAFIKAYAAHLKSGGKFRLPSWADYVKTSAAKELAPYDPEWFYIRAAAILRHLYFRPDQGVNAFRTLYGSKKRRGSAPGHHTKAAGGIIRYCLRQFQSMGLVHKGEDGGRRLTSKGQQEINSIARLVHRETV